MSPVPINLKRKGLKFGREVALYFLLSIFCNYKDKRPPPMALQFFDGSITVRIFHIISAPFLGAILV